MDANWITWEDDVTREDRNLLFEVAAYLCERAEADKTADDLYRRLSALIDADEHQ